MNKSFQSVLAATLIAEAAREVADLKRSSASVERKLAEEIVARPHGERARCLARLRAGMARDIRSLREFMIEQSKLLD